MNKINCQQKFLQVSDEINQKKKINSFNDRLERDVIKTEMRTLNETFEKQSTENGKKLGCIEDGYIFDKEFFF